MLSDEITLFHISGQDHLAAIGVITGARGEMVVADHKIAIALTNRAKRRPGRAGYVPAHGARPVKRGLQRYLLNRLGRR